MHPEISMHTYPLGQYMLHIRTGNWRGVADLMLSSANKLVEAGAEFAIPPDNTIHQAFEFVLEKSPVPWLHIAEVVAEEARINGFSRLAVLGTKYLMVGPVYPSILKKFGISYKIPSETEREQIDKIIFDELVNGVFEEKSRQYIYNLIQNFKEQGCDAAVLGCTEIPLLVNPEESPLPTLASTRLLARAALKYSTEAKR